MTRKSSVSVVFGPMRLPFLILAPVCALLGGAVAIHEGGAFHWGYFLIAMVGAVFAHISVNAFNEYEDFKSGLDFSTQRTPFSGGSGALPDNPAGARVALAIAWIFLIITVLVGLFFVRIWGMQLLPLGILGIVTIVLYTRWLTRNPFLCLIAPGIGFGPCIVMGTEFVVTGVYSVAALTASFVPFFLVSNLLLLNQFPDLEPDASVGRRHLLILWGRKTGARVYAFFLAGTYVTIIAGYLAGLFPAASLISLATAVIAVQTARGALRHGGDIPALTPYLGKNVVLTLLTPLLLAVGLVLG